MQIGDIVLIREKSIPRNSWKSGRVCSTNVSNDGIVRSCLVQTTTGEYRRAVADLVLLQRPSLSRGECPA